MCELNAAEVGRIYLHNEQFSNDIFDGSKEDDDDLYVVVVGAVCNGRKDCADGSDEARCESIVFGDNYLQDLPPIANSNL